MLTLVIDTASSRGLVGLVEGDRAIAEHAWDLGSTYSKELLAQVDALLRETGTPRDALGAVVVNVGPGGYGSLRVGVATAQGLALALDIPLAGVRRLEADAAAHLDGEQVVVAVHAAGNSGTAWAAYAGTADDVREVAPPRLGTLEECVEAAPSAALWCGELTDEMLGSLGRTGKVWAVVPPQDNHRRALDFARLARAHGAFGNPAVVDVFYLRPPSITRARQ